MTHTTTGEGKKKIGCMDCKMPYSKFPFDLLFPRAQWLLINPQDVGLLCANCMLKRARKKIKGATVVHAVVEVAPLLTNR
jgi:hypothetical protein